MCTCYSFSDGSGRSGWNSKSKPIIGHVILHDKLKYWQTNDRSTHYHQGKYVISRSLLINHRETRKSQLKG